MSQREALLEAAISCLNECGYHRTTSREIAATAGISSLAAIVYHYGSKEALLNEAIAEIVRRWIDHLQQLMTSAGGDVAGLLAAVDEYYGTLEANQPALGGFVEALGQAQRSGEVRAQLAQHYQGFRDMLTVVFEQTEGEQKSARELHTVTSLLMALVDGLLIQWLLDPATAVNAEDLREAAASLVATFLTPPTNT